MTVIKERHADSENRKQSADLRELLRQNSQFGNQEVDYNGLDMHVEHIDDNDWIKCHTAIKVEGLLFNGLFLRTTWVSQHQKR